MPTLYIIAGPNGAGKTTASLVLLPDFFGVLQFVNADEIAKGFSHSRPMKYAFLYRALDKMVGLDRKMHNNLTHCAIKPHPLV